MTGEELITEYEKFMSSRQEALRLDIALKGFQVLTQSSMYAQNDKLMAAKQNYVAYLKKRVRPAVQQIALRGGTDLLDAMWKEQIITKPVISELLKQREIQKHPTVWVKLLGMQAARDFEEGSDQVGSERISDHMDQRSTDPAFLGGAYAAGVCQTQILKKHDVKEADHSRVARKMLLYSRAILYELYPYLDAAVAALLITESPDTVSMGTDGVHLFYNSAYVIDVFRKDPAYLTGLYLHQILHCIFRHWENQLCEDTFFDQQIYDVLQKEKKRSTRCDEQICMTPALKDDHSLWPDPTQTEAISRIASFWEDIQLHIGNGNGGAGASILGIGNNAGDQNDLVGPLHRSGYDYRTFLKSFAVRREEMELDHESFDYIYYSLGMDTYGNMPLIEPLEYKEGHKLEELVIAIDTSGSCSLSQVKRFLEESYQILCEKENFFRKMKVYILQCDCTIQDAALIRSEEDWNDYCRNLKIYGRSGTNFKPVFQYVDRLIEQGELKNLKGLIYFTDGNGTFPTWKPAYQSAFVFVKKDMGLEKLPTWAIGLELPADYEEKTT